MQQQIAAQPEERFYFYGFENDFDGVWTKEYGIIVTELITSKCVTQACRKMDGYSYSLSTTSYISTVGYHTIRIVIAVLDDSANGGNCYLAYSTAAQPSVVNTFQNTSPSKFIMAEILIPDNDDTYNNQATFQLGLGNHASSHSAKCYYDNLEIYGIPYTLNPTLDPTPSPIPTVIPTHHPTVYPTFYPTLNPTFDPTFHPTVYPTFYPTSNPTFNPTSNSTFYPTLNPIFESTDTPSFALTSSSSYTPTKQPTDTSSVIPTDRPSISTINSSNGGDVVNTTIDIDVILDEKEDDVDNKMFWMILISCITIAVIYCICIALMVIILSKNRKKYKVQSQEMTLSVINKEICDDSKAINENNKIPMVGDDNGDDEELYAQNNDDVIIITEQHTINGITDDIYIAESDSDDETVEGVDNKHTSKQNNTITDQCMDSGDV